MKCDAILIAGPTASGKSAAALALAEQIGGVIVNADSMQVYREARILTARPFDDEMARAPHLLYGHVSVREHYSVGRYQADAKQALDEARKLGSIPIFVGGTGLYFSVLTDGIADIPSVPAKMREQAVALRKELDAEAFHKVLAKHDPDRAARLTPTDTQRVLRAYEVFAATGRPLSYWQTQLGQPVLAGLSLKRFVLMPERAELYRRIDARFDRMVADGAIEEAASLADLDPLLPSAKILGRRELLAARDGTITLDEALVRAKTASRQYAKRQMTWMRQRMKDWTWASDASELAHANL